jgi:hypothetical protein
MRAQLNLCPGASLISALLWSIFGPVPTLRQGVAFSRLRLDLVLDSDVKAGHRRPARESVGGQALSCRTK